MTAPAGTDGDGDALPLSAYYEQALVRDVALSPSGDRAAFTTTEFDADEEESVSSLFVAPTDGSRDPHRLTRVSQASDPAWSPDGSKLGFLAARDVDTELRSATTKDDGDDESEEDDDGADVAEDDEPEDGDEEAAEREDDEAEEDDDEGTEHGEEEQQVFVFDMALGGDARQVTTREYGVDEFDWSPDGDRIVVSARDPTEVQAEYLEEREDDGPIETERLQHKANGHGWTDEVRTYLFVVDVASREIERLDGAYASGASIALAGDSLAPEWGSGDRIAFYSYQREDADDTWATDVHTIAPDGSDHRVLTDGTVRASGQTWHPDGERLAYFEGDAENNYVTSDLVVGPDDPEGDRRVLSGDLELPEYAPGWVDDDTLLVPVGDSGQTVLHRVDAETGERERVFPAAGDEETSLLRYGSLEVSTDGNTAAFVLTRPDEANVYALDVAAVLEDGPTVIEDGPTAIEDGPTAIEGGPTAIEDGPTVADDVACEEATRLTTTNEAITDAVDVECERLAFESDDGVDVEGFAYHAADADFDEHAYPVIVNIHGGPTVYDQPLYRFVYHYWASRGYVVLNVNYRGSTSYGHEFSEAIRGDWGPRESRDVVAGVEHLVEREWVDPERVFVTGFSQGGINTAFVLAYSDVATAGAAEHGIYDFYSAYGTDDCHVWWENEFGEPWEDPESYYERSSITKVDRIDDPLLLTAGETDWRCPPSQAEQMYVAVKKQGVDSKLVVYPNVPHALGPPETATHRVETVMDWFREHDPSIEVDDGDDDDAGEDGVDGD